MRKKNLKSPFNNFMEQWSFNSHFYDKVNFWQTIHEKPLLLRHANR